MSFLQRLRDAWRLPELSRTAAQSYHPGQKAAIEALGAIDSARAHAPILAALNGNNRDVYAVAATAAGRRRLEAARPALVRLSEYYQPPPNPDYQPESWAQDRVEREFADAQADEIRAAATAALRLLDGG